VNAITAKNWDLKKAELIQLGEQAKQEGITSSS